MKNVKIIAISYALPDHIVNNADLEKMNDGWELEKFTSKTGVLERREVADDETAFTLGLQACRSLLSVNNIDAKKIEALIVCTQTPDFVMPPNSCLLHAELGMRSDALAFDFNLACSGYVYGLDLASSLIKSGRVKNVLFVAGDTYSKLMNKKDRSIRTLFGDGVSATYIEETTTSSNITNILLGTDGKKYDHFYIEAGGARYPSNEETSLEYTDKSGNVRSKEQICMNGFGVLSFFNSIIPKEVGKVLDSASIGIDDVDYFIFHQASKLALDGISKALKISEDKMIVNMADTGNLVSASIPVVFARAIDDGHIKRGDTVLLCGFGVGLSWGTALVKY